jgi:copper homeostasis protein
LVEAAVESVEGAIVAERAGAQRIELCANLTEGGTTPSAGTIGEALARVRVPIFVMIRPRGGDFLYTRTEIEVMIRDIAIAQLSGAHGIVLGVLTRDGAVDAQRMSGLVEAARPLPVTFHRAFDLAADMDTALETLIACGVTRVLTSGGAPRAGDAIPRLAELVARAGDRISVMPGGGISAANAKRIVDETGAREIHVGGTMPVASGMRFRRSEISFARPALVDEYTLTVADEGRLRGVIAAVTGLGLELPAEHPDGPKRGATD